MFFINKKVLITGSGTGIGKDAALALAERGHRVYATTHYEDEAQELNKIANNKNISLEAFKLDILEEEDRKLVHKYEIDVLINNAAMPQSGSVSEIPLDRLRLPFETNVFSAVALTQEVLKDMIKRKHGRVIFITSVMGRITMPFFSPYSATKHALEAIADSLNSEMERLKKDGIDIPVSIIEPGAYATGFNQRMLETKFEWMDEKSYFSNHLKEIKEEEIKFFNSVELKSNRSIVKEYIKAVEDENPKLRYYAPKLQAAAVQFMRMIGK